MDLQTENNLHLMDLGGQSSLIHLLFLSLNYDGVLPFTASCSRNFPQFPDLLCKKIFSSLCFESSSFISYTILLLTLDYLCHIYLNLLQLFYNILERKGWKQYKIFMAEIYRRFTLIAHGLLFFSLSITSHLLTLNLIHGEDLHFLWYKKECDISKQAHSIT